VIDVLAARAAALNADIVLPWDGANHYLAAVYRTELASLVDDLVAAGERDIAALIKRADTQRVVVTGAGSYAEAEQTSGVA
jgi:molybdopterin-guanine dinucleotide biosynthesis protein A